MAVAGINTAADVLSAIATLTDELGTRASEMEEARRLPADLAQKLTKTDAFQILAPKTVDGLELTAREFAEIVETLARPNASAAWCVMIAATTTLSAAYMAPDAATEIFKGPSRITGGVVAPMGKAVIDGDYYRVSGRWQWGSGSANCQWLGGGCTLWENGEMKRLPDGSPDTRMVFFPADQATLHDTWHVMGLKGTGSGDFEVKDIRVPKTRSISLLTDKPHETGPLYKFPIFGLLALGVAAVALGNAGGALSSLKTLAGLRKGASGKPMAARSTVQAAYAKMEAEYRAVRSYLFGEIDRVWAIATGEAGSIPLEARGDLRLVCTHTTRICAEICRNAYEMGGGSSLFLTSDLQRRFRDAHAATQHILVGSTTYEVAGRLLFDLPVNSAQI